MRWKMKTPLRFSSCARRRRSVSAFARSATSITAFPRRASSCGWFGPSDLRRRRHEPNRPDDLAVGEVVADVEDPLRRPPGEEADRVPEVAPAAAARRRSARRRRRSGPARGERPRPARSAPRRRRRRERRPAMTRIRFIAAPPAARARARSRPAGSRCASATQREGPRQRRAQAPLLGRAHGAGLARRTQQRGRPEEST